MKLIVIGSGSSVHLKMNSPFVSGYHAELLLLDNGDILLTDKGSRNGTFLNDKRLQPNKDIPIKRGDLVRFADQTLDWRNIPSISQDPKIKEIRGIGTNFRNKYQLQGDRVSRFHATLKRMSDNNWYIQDHSKNGTIINGKIIPSNQDIKLKRGDKILCAGNPVPNPYGERNPINYRKIFTTTSLILFLCCGTYGIVRHLSNLSDNREEQTVSPTPNSGDKVAQATIETTNSGDKVAKVTTGTTNSSDKVAQATIETPAPKDKVTSTTTNTTNSKDKVTPATAKDTNSKKKVATMSDEEIYAKYKNSIVLLVGYYYYKVTAGNLDLESLGLPTEVILTDNSDYPIQIVDELSSMENFCATGFFVSNDAKIATNLHAVRPWLFEKDSSYISDFYKMVLANLASEDPAFNAFISQIKVEGVLSYIGMIPNGAYFSSDNLKRCRELVGHDNIGKDVAILQLETKKLPDDCKMVNIDHAVVKDSDIRVGSHIYTMGFPMGLSLQDLQTSKGLRVLANNGNITQECNEYSFGFNAPSYGGASGSPIFNNKGQLIGVLNSGVTATQGFNYGIKAIHVKELLKQTK